MPLWLADLRETVLRKQLDAVCAALDKAVIQ